ncbi:hypothetical protein AB833_32225 [Chromatiales bacterium (ex Bugula neritina AB1)]|nr:hypothetical protein AB833_32225 [Chromatiales bacterium (ex Bugula neritina AB1)]
MKYPPIESVIETSKRIADHVIRTPTVPYYGLTGLDTLLPDTKVWLKMELTQRTGSFKARGALNVLMHLDEARRANGVTAFSAGNHAIATAFAARVIGTSARVVMPKTANPYRVACCKALGADVEFGEDISELISIVNNLQRDEGRTMVHPFEGQHTFEGTATIGLELCNDIPDLDAVIVPVGGGGLIAGIAAAVKQLNSNCLVFGVEPEGAQGMSQSLKNGAPLDQVSVNTIADSLGAPMHLPESYAIVESLVDDLVTVSDDQLRSVMRSMLTDLNLCVEPACASAMTALLHPLRERLGGKRVAIILCGSNIDLNTFNRIVE